MKKLILIILGLFVLQSMCFAKDIIEFDFPNEGWHKVQSPDKIETKKCYVPYNQTSENYTEMLIFQERALKNKDIGAMIILHKQLGKDRTNYFDILPQYVKQDMDDAMYTWCSEAKKTCSITRAFKADEGVVLVTYLNKMPHYSQNIFTNWMNIVGSVKLYNKTVEKTSTTNLIQL